LKIQQPSSASEYRAQIQSSLLNFLEYPKLDEELIPLLKRQALVAWPQGSTADQIRLEQIHALRDSELARKPLSQEWRNVARVYQEHLDEVRSLTPESPLVGTLEEDLIQLESRLQEIYPQAVEVFESNIFETEFLETFANNYPDAKEIADVSLALGIAYSRLGHENDAVEFFLRAMEENPDSSAGKQALVGLRNLTPRIDSLSALEQLASEISDQELREASETRLARLASQYEALENGAEYLKKYPDGEQHERVSSRLNQLADEMYAEFVLYQSVGDHVKGIERIQRILTYAPHSPAADRLREQLVLES
jgi:tetratricopeptide (TPR) repeat protein